jgi:SAM-dependent methyltransferase
MLRILRRTLWQSAVIPRAEQGADFYNDRYTRKAAYHLPYHLSPYYPIWTVVADRLRHRRAHVLEVGCGAGQLARLLIDQGVASYTGFDLSPVAVALAAQNGPGPFLVDDAFTTNLFNTAHYNTIVCTEVLEHVERDRALVARWPTGTRCLFTIPDFWAKAHVRVAESEAWVQDRFGDLFAGLDVTTLKRPAQKGGRFFLGEGVRL